LFKNNHKNVEEGKISFCNPWQMWNDFTDEEPP
jgi:hypothetical protein